MMSINMMFVALAGGATEMWIVSAQIFEFVDRDMAKICYCLGRINSKKMCYILLCAVYD